MNEPEAQPGKPPTYYSAGRIAVLIIGTVLLLPGGCVFVMFIFSVSDAARKGQPLDFSDPFAQLMLIVWAICLVISAIGVALIVAVMKRIRSARRATRPGG
jgi:hypothetical protein